MQVELKQVQNKT